MSVVTWIGLAVGLGLADADAFCAGLADPTETADGLGVAAAGDGLEAIG